MVKPLTVKPKITDKPVKVADYYLNRSNRDWLYYKKKNIPLTFDLLLVKILINFETGISSQNKKDDPEIGNENLWVEHVI